MAIFEKKHPNKDPKGDVAPADLDSSVGDRDAQVSTAEKGGKPVGDPLSGAAPLREGAHTTTTTDSLRDQGGVETQSVGEIDKRTPEERLEQVRGWKKKIGPRQPQSGDWEEFDQIVGSGSIADVRRPT